jgi:hypothetical protein
VFGKPGGGKSTLSRQIAAATKLPLHQLDLVQYQRGGSKVPDAGFLRRHAEIMAQEQWVVDGFGNPQAFTAMLHAADVLVYVERFSLDSLLVGYKAASEKPALQATRLARRQSHAEFDDQQLLLPQTVTQILELGA